jgi:Domain of unknown function (DUF4190)
MTDYPGQDPEQGPPPSSSPEESSPGSPYGPPPPASPPYGAPPPASSPYGAGPPPSSYGYPSPGASQQWGQSGYGYPARLPDHPQSTLAMILGIVALGGGMVCGLPLLAAPFAWFLGQRARRQIRESHGQLGGDGQALTGMVTGIIGTVLLVLAVLVLVLFVVIGVLGVGASNI